MTDDIDHADQSVVFFKADAVSMALLILVGTHPFRNDLLGHVDAFVSVPSQITRDFRIICPRFIDSHCIMLVQPAQIKPVRFDCFFRRNPFIKFCALFTDVIVKKFGLLDKRKAVFAI